MHIVQLVKSKIADYRFDFEMAMRRSVIGKDTLRLFFMEPSSLYPFWWPSLTKDLQTESVVLHKQVSNESSLTTIQSCKKEVAALLLY